MLPTNSSYTLKTATDYSIVDTTIQGENKVWDFSKLTVDTQGNELVVTVKDPSKTPKASEFTNSNIAYYESPNDAYRYFNLTDSKMERVGSFAAQTLKTYDNPQIEYVFPLIYGSSSNDTWSNNISSFGGTYELKCIGTGTLKLPNGSHEALMVRVRLTELFVIDSYFWYSATDGTLLVQFIVGDGFLTSTSAKFQTQKSLSVSENMADFTQFNMVNPVMNELSFSFKTAQTHLNYIITDLQGKQIKNASISSDAERITVSENVSGLTQGMYILQVYSGYDLLATRKFTKN